MDARDILWYIYECGMQSPLGTKSQFRSIYVKVEVSRKKKWKFFQKFLLEFWIPPPRFCFNVALADASVFRGNM